MKTEYKSLPSQVQRACRPMKQDGDQIRPGIRQPDAGFNSSQANMHICNPTKSSMSGGVARTGVMSRRPQQTKRGLDFISQLCHLSRHLCMIRLLGRWCACYCLRTIRTTSTVLTCWPCTSAVRTMPSEVTPACMLAGQLHTSTTKSSCDVLNLENEDTT